MSVKCTHCNLVWNNLKVDYESDEGDGVCPQCCSSLDLVDSEEVGYIYNPLMGVFTNEQNSKQVFLYKPQPQKKARADTGLTWEEKQRLRIEREDLAIESYIKGDCSTEDFFNTIKS